MRFSQWLETDEHAIDWASRHGVEVTPDGMFILYHGTTHAKEIRKSGFFQTRSNFETDANDAAEWAERSFLKGKDEVEVMKVKVPPDKLSLTVWAIAQEPIPVIEV
jgi:hypothetical protein